MVFYRYHHYSEIAVRLATKQYQKCIYANLIPDEDDGTFKTPNIRDTICISNRFLKRIENMNKLILPNLRTK